MVAKEDHRDLSKEDLNKEHGQAQIRNQILLLLHGVEVIRQVILRMQTDGYDANLRRQLKKRHMIEIEGEHLFELGAQGRKDEELH